jgi:hypothetical protein
MGKHGKRESSCRFGDFWRPSAAMRRWPGAAIGFDAVKHLVLCRIERRPLRLDLTVYPYLPRAIVATTSPRTYMDLLTGVTS